jgi:hypothetical protein
MRSLLGLYQALRGDPLSWSAEIVWLADELLDRIPAREDDVWHRYGDW